MAEIFHPATGFLIGDPELSPFESGRLPSPPELETALSGLILSASGWRKVFASPEPGEPRASWTSPRAVPLAAPMTASSAAKSGSAIEVDEDSLSPRVSTADLFLAGAMASVFTDFLRERSGRPDPAVLVGIDSRPTGPALADAMCRVFLGLGARPRYLFIVAAPEIMAYSRQASLVAGDHDDRAEGFCYVSASHNPPGHNGVKFGVGGGVLPGKDSARLIEAFKALAASPDLVKRILYAAEAADPRELARVYSGVSAWKRRSISAYTLFSHEVVSGSADPAEQGAFLDGMASGAASRRISVLAELNGSARALSIDADFLGALGVGFKGLNDRPREFAHRIVPEGESLADCRKALEEAAAADPSFVAGYVPDCDGDRGNLVIMEGGRGGPAHGHVLGAQEVFALCCMAECAQLARSAALRGGAMPKAAIAVNDATSMRIEELASAFGVEVRRAETGEANVVGLAEELRGQGYTVRIMGEGSNGGNITWPASVRDPLATVSALLKVLLVRDVANGLPADRGHDAGGVVPGLYRIWLEKTGRGLEYREDFSLGDVIASLPAWSTTSAFEAEAMLKIRSADHAALKARYRDAFLAAWRRDRAEFEKRLGAVSWEAFASKGSSESAVGEDFAASGKGGLRIVFSDAAGRKVAFVWMRGSGTEPVFRVMADVGAFACTSGSADANQAWLLDWHRALVLEADRG
jgi:phosphoglucomutase